MYGVGYVGTWVRGVGWGGGGGEGPLPTYPPFPSLSLSHPFLFPPLFFSFSHHTHPNLSTPTKLTNLLHNRVSPVP